MAILSIIFGVVSFIIFGIPLGFADIICGGIAASRGDNLGIAGVVLGVIGAALAFVLIML